MSRKLYLSHTGTPQMFDFDPNGSGRYRQGSGENPHQHALSWRQQELLALKEINPATGQLWTRTERAKALGMSTKEWRARMTAGKNADNKTLLHRIIKMREEDQMSPDAIAKELGISGTTVRKMLTNGLGVKAKEFDNICDVLKDQVEKYGYIDVGEGAEVRLGIAETQLAAAVQYLEKEEGYSRSKLFVNQLQSQQTGQKSTNIVLGPKTDEDPKEIKKYLYNHLDEIHMINDVISKDMGLTFHGMDYKPLPLSMDRVEIKYADADGYQPKDGIIEIRPGVADISLGANQCYSQVRINVEDKYYMKGVAIYNKNLPEGVDIRFNTNKAEGAPLEKVFKPLKRERKIPGTDQDDPNSPIDWKNPFGATIQSEEKGGQYKYTDENGEQHLSLINKVNPEGSWAGWNRALAPQFLAKQPEPLIQRQINAELYKQQAEFEDIKAITNPVVKRNLLLQFANDCDGNSADLKAHALPRQTTRVLLPAESLKYGELNGGVNECYAPGYENGDEVCLIRFPHSGPCEILKCTVNNKNKEARDILSPGGKSSEKDVIFINPKGAAKLSGADFDGDSVVVIPAKGVKVERMLKQLEGFDSKAGYERTDPNVRKMTKKDHGIEMGKAANLINDMMAKGAITEGPDATEYANALKYSMIVVDAYKHDLDYRQAAKDLGIDKLRKKYQGKSSGGASTLLSRSKAPSWDEEISPYSPINKETGDIETQYTHKTHKKYIPHEDGTVEVREEANKTKRKRMLTVSDAYELVSDPNHPLRIEVQYAEFSNALKNMARQARLEYVNTEVVPKNAAAAKAYEKEVNSLNNKLELCLSQQGYERAAQRIANQELKNIQEENGKLDRDEYKKKSSQILASARKRVYPKGKREKVEITEREWEAIQANAISATVLDKIIKFADADQVRSYATPRNSNNRSISDAQIRRIQRLKQQGYTVQELASEFNIAEGTIRNYLTLDV